MAQPHPHHAPGSAVPPDRRSTIVPALRASTFWEAKRLLDAANDEIATEAQRTMHRAAAVQLLAGELNHLTPSLTAATVEYHSSPPPDHPTWRASTGGWGGGIDVDVYPRACTDVATLWVALNHEFAHVNQRSLPAVFRGDPVPGTRDTMAFYREFLAYLDTLERRDALGVSLRDLVLCYTMADIYFPLLSQAEQAVVRERWDVVRAPVVKEITDRHGPITPDARQRIADGVLRDTPARDGGPQFNKAIDDLMRGFGDLHAQPRNPDDVIDNLLHGLGPTPGTRRPLDPDDPLVRAVDDLIGGPDPVSGAASRPSASLADPSSLPVVAADQASSGQLAGDGLTVPGSGDPQDAQTGLSAMADGLTDPPGHPGDDLPPAVGDQSAWGGVADGFQSLGDQDPGFQDPGFQDPGVQDPGVQSATPGGAAPPDDAPFDPPPNWNR